MHSTADQVAHLAQAAQVARRLASPLDGAASHTLHAITAALPDALALFALRGGVTAGARTLAAAGLACQRAIPKPPSPDPDPAPDSVPAPRCDDADRLADLATVLTSLTIEAGAHPWRQVLARQDGPQPIDGAPWFGLERTWAPGFASILAGTIGGEYARRDDPAPQYRLLVVLPATEPHADLSAQTELTAFLAACDKAIQSRLRQGLEAELGLATDPSTPTGSPGRRTPADLTPTETLILSLLRRHLTEKQVAAELDRSPHTVHVHVKSIYRKMGVNSRVHLLEQLDDPGRTDPPPA